MQNGGWRQCETWHELFDWLCVETGHDDATLARAYSAQVGRKNSVNLDATQKNLRSWRLGRHLPIRRNVVALGKMLNVDADPELRQRWLALYNAARVPMGVTGAETPAEAYVSVLRSPRPAWHWLALALGVVAFGAAAYYGFQRWQFNQLPLIGYTARVRLVVGESRLIHGDRLECRNHAPEWAEVVHRVPTSRLGQFTDGGPARKMDNACGRVIAARAARFTATRSGEEEIELFGDFIKLEVADGVTPPQ